MALTGDRKKEYQRKYMAQYRLERKHREIASQIRTGWQEGLMLDPVRPSGVRPPVKPNVDNLRQMIKTIEDKGKPRNAPQRPSGEASLPLYNPALHKPGDRVLVKPNYGKKLVETVIPALDADGNSMPDYD